MFIWLFRKGYRAFKARRGKKQEGGEAVEADANTDVSPEPTDPVELARFKAERKARIKYRLRLMVALAIPVFLETLDYTVVATTQTHIASSFNRLDLQSYIGTIYLLTSTVFLPLFASIADVFGRHWALQTSLALFLIGSALSTGAQNMAMMLAGRGISGIGAAGLLTVVRVILSDSTSLDDNNWQAASMVVLYSIGFCVGPAIGGALIEVDFRWIFGINLPLTALSMVIAFFLLRGTTKGPQPLSRSTEKTSLLSKILLIDWPASFLFCAGGILLLLGLNWGSVDASASEGWDSARVIASLVVGSVLLVATIAWDAVLEGRLARRFGYHFRPSNEKPKDVNIAPDSEALSDSSSPPPSVDRDRRNVFTPIPLLPLSVFASYDVVATELAAFTAGMVMIVLFYFVAMFMVVVTGLSAVSAGVQLIYFAPGMGAGTIIAITMIKRLRQPKYPIVLGTLLVPIALGLISEAIHSNNQDRVNGFMVMAGVGVGMTFGPLAIHARFSQPEERVAIVVALNLFFRSLGGTVGLAQCFTVMNAKVREYFTSLPLSVLESAGLTSGSLSSLGAATHSSTEAIDDLSPAAQELIRNAFRNGVRWSFISLIPWCGVSFIAVLFLSNIKDTDRVAKGHEVTSGSGGGEKTVSDESQEKPDEKAGGSNSNQVV